MSLGERKGLYERREPKDYGTRGQRRDEETGEDRGIFESERNGPGTNNQKGSRVKNRGKRSTEY